MDNSPSPFVFPAVAHREIVASFDGGDLTSDVELLLLAQADNKLGLISALARVISDRRQQGKVRHSLQQILGERIFAIACGYEDANDLKVLRKDPALNIACGRLP